MYNNLSVIYELKWKRLSWLTCRLTYDCIVSHESVFTQPLLLLGGKMKNIYNYLIMPTASQQNTLNMPAAEGTFTALTQSNFDVEIVQ
jgi:hypothetical protein